MGKVILVIAIVIVVGAGAAFAGYRMGDAAGFERANQVRQQFAQQRQSSQLAQGGAGAGGAGGFTSGGGAAGRAFAVQGTVKSVEGDTVTVAMGNREVKVKLGDKTQMWKSVAGARSELAAGVQVMITPEGSLGGSGAGAGGDLTAASVTILPAQ